jgi:hypothetical protein
LLATLVACGTTAGHEKTTDIAGQYARLGEDLADLKRDVDTAVEALDALPRSKAGDARSPFDSLSSATASMGSRLGSLQAARASTHEAASEHFAAWGAQNATIGDAQLKSRAEERHGELKGQLGTVDVAVQKGLAMAGSFSSAVQDLNKYLANDLSPAAVGNAADLIARTHGEGSRLSVRLDGLAKDVAHYAGKLGAK